MPHYIYGLADPRNEETIIYVGITTNLYRRFCEHIRGKDVNGNKNSWILQLQNENMIPTLKLLETVATIEEARAREAYWIQHHSAKSVSLVNIKRPKVRDTPVPSVVDKGYYTAEETRGLFKMTRTYFYKLVEKGGVPYVVDEGHKRGKRFPKEAIDALVRIGHYA